MLEGAAQAAAEAATHEESKPENEYDTRALEASYLAGAQLARLNELKGALATLLAPKPRTAVRSGVVGVNSLVELDQEGETMLCFITRVGGGYPLEWHGRPVVAVAPASPLGQALVERSVGDVVAVGKGDAEREYEIMSVD